MQRLIISSKNENITLVDVTREVHGEIFEKTEIKKMDGEENDKFNLEEMVNSYEKALIKYACDKYGTTRKAAAAAGISQTQLVRKKKKYEI